MKECRGYPRKSWHALSITKKGQESTERAELWSFNHHYSKHRAFGTLHPPKRRVFLELSIENKAFYFSKMVRSG